MRFSFKRCYKWGTYTILQHDRGRKTATFSERRSFYTLIGGGVGKKEYI